jgi:hypothetical protein
MAGHPQIEPLHVALAALEDANGVARAAVLRAAGIVDMFAQTTHLESIAVLDGPGVTP